MDPLGHLSFELSMQPGGRDANGNLIAGTEVMRLVGHKRPALFPSWTSPVRIPSPAFT